MISEHATMIEKTVIANADKEVSNLTRASIATKIVYAENKESLGDTLRYGVRNVKICSNTSKYQLHSRQAALSPHSLIASLLILNPWQLLSFLPYPPPPILLPLSPFQH